MRALAFRSGRNTHRQVAEQSDHRLALGHGIGLPASDERLLERHARLPPRGAAAGAPRPPGCGRQQPRDRARSAVARPRAHARRRGAPAGSARAPPTASRRPARARCRAHTRASRARTPGPNASRTGLSSESATTCSWKPARIAAPTGPANAIAWSPSSMSARRSGSKGFMPRTLHRAGSARRPCRIGETPLSCALHRAGAPRAARPLPGGRA